MKAIVFLEAVNGEVKTASFDAVAAAYSVADEVKVVAFQSPDGSEPRIRMLTHVLPDFGYLSEFVRKENANFVFLPGTKWGNWIGVSLAAVLDSPFLADVIAINDGSFKQNGLACIDYREQK